MTARSGRKIGWGFAALALLAGCDGLGLPELPSAADAEVAADAQPVATLALQGGAVIAAGPRGYCADTQASKPTAGFAIFASCATFDPEAANAGPVGIATVQVGADGSAAVTDHEADYAAFLEAEGGAAVLSRSGDAATVDVQSTKEESGAVSVRFTDSSPSDVAGEQALQWRAFVDVNGRLVTISVRGLKDAPLARATGSELLRQAIRALRTANVPQDDT